MYVVADLDTEEGLALVQYALTYLVRLTLSHIPSAMSDSSHTVDYTGRQLTNLVCPQPCNTGGGGREDPDERLRSFLTPHRQRALKQLDARTPLTRAQASCALHR